MFDTMTLTKVVGGLFTADLFYDYANHYTEEGEPNTQSIGPSFGALRAGCS